MDYLEEKTCLRFVHSTSIFRIRIRFQRKKPTCSSNYVGKKPQWHLLIPQVINLGNGCNNKRIILHVIGHAIGFWHEQSRPDRNNFVKPIKENICIAQGKWYDFRRQNNRQVNYQRTSYDYGSIMHYSETAFNNCIGCSTLKIVNQQEYFKQGQPELGSTNKYSPTDIEQVNRMYSCPGTGVKGILKVKVKSATDLPDTDVWGLPEPYVKPTAIDNNGNKI